MDNRVSTPVDPTPRLPLAFGNRRLEGRNERGMTNTHQRVTRTMAQHILMTYATRRPYRATPAMPEHTQYDPVKGYWRLRGHPLMTSEASLQDGVQTKKADQETGEDQKGE